MADIDWTISGKILVEDWITVNAVVGTDANDGDNRIERPMRSVEVQISAARTGSVFKAWDTARTGIDGSFSVTVRKSDKPRRFRVRVRLRDDKLQVKKNVGPTAPEWLTVYDSKEKRDGPDVDVGNRVFRPGANAYTALFGYQSRVRALYWYLIRTVITVLEDHDPRFGFKERVTVVFPCARDISSAWAGAARIERDADNLVTVIHEVMHLWNYQHNTGTSSWVRAWVDDGDIADSQEFPSIAFHEGFAEYAAWELAYLIWGRNGIEGIGTDPAITPIEQGLPHSRRNLSSNRTLTTLGSVERNDHGVLSGLRLLTSERLAGLVLGTAVDWPNPPGDEFVYAGTVTHHPHTVPRDR